jgi:hypothetical protein
MSTAAHACTLGGRTPSHLPFCGCTDDHELEQADGLPRVPRLSTQADPAGLTARELDVLRL